MYAFIDGSSPLEAALLSLFTVLQTLGQWTVGLAFGTALLSDRGMTLRRQDHVTVMPGVRRDKQLRAIREYYVQNDTADTKDTWLTALYIAL